MPPAFELLKDPLLLDQTLETAQRGLDILAFSYSNSDHNGVILPILSRAVKF